MIRRPPRSTQSRSSAASDVYKRQVKVVEADGTEKAFLSEEAEATVDELLAEHKLLEMDCLSCHNQPAHPVRSPQLAVNEALAAGALDVSLPAIKQVGVKVL